MDKDKHDETDYTDLAYPPGHVKKMEKMIEYFLQNKTLPTVLPEYLRFPSVEKEFPKHLIPLEMICQHCPGKVPLSEPVFITHRAKILTTTQVIHDVSTYINSCPQCEAFYRYQEWKDGLHNFNDHMSWFCFSVWPAGGMSGLQGVHLLPICNHETLYLRTILLCICVGVLLLHCYFHAYRLVSCYRSRRVFRSGFSVPLFSARQTLYFY